MHHPGPSVRTKNGPSGMQVLASFGERLFIFFVVNDARSYSSPSLSPPIPSLTIFSRCSPQTYTYTLTDGPYTISNPTLVINELTIYYDSLSQHSSEPVPKDGDKFVFPRGDTIWIEQAGQDNLLFQNVMQALSLLIAYYVNAVKAGEEHVQANLALILGEGRAQGRVYIVESGDGVPGLGLGRCGDGDLRVGNGRVS